MSIDKATTIGNKRTLEFRKRNFTIKGKPTIKITMFVVLFLVFVNK